ncbi:hypothetical protein [Microcystis aeruginosa]|uniref:hypothetical protein n=1 Tax=Microcystis aeruginosa TaxID=1126 RepID=UPI001881C75F|nr:hypothetical protein [Microcystis aeruginosa]MBE8994780.1 hypothetical protein [Microcystis aeruginosa LEGE 91341]
MTKVLIDNATISSVQRALGKAPLKEPALLDIEHVALSRFSEAVLLSDGVIIPDNYKAELTASRKALISDDLFHFQELKGNEDAEIVEICNSLLGIWREAFHAGSERSLFSEYFSQVKAFSNFIWEHASSEFFLVFRAHGINKENPLIEAVLASPANEGLGSELQIIGTDGNVVAWDKLSRPVQRMLSVMGWLGHQYIWYQIFSAQYDCSYLPHPLRDFFAYDFLNRVDKGARSKSAFASAFADEIGKFQGRLKNSLEALGQLESAININLPGFLPLLICESSSGNDFLPVLHQMRQEPEVTELREMLKDIQQSIEKGDYKPLAKMKREIEAIGKNILIEKGLEDRFLKITPPTTMLGIKVEGDDSSIKLRIPSALYKQYFVGRRYRSFVKRVMEELAVPAQYGDLKTKLNSYAWIEEDKFSKFYLKQDRFPSKFHKPFTTASLEPSQVEKHNNPGAAD